MDTRKLPSISFRVRWPAPERRRSSAKIWAVGLAVAAGAALAALGARTIRSALAGVTMHHRARPHANGAPQKEPWVDASG